MQETTIPEFTANDIKLMRGKLGESQEVFADRIKVSTQAVGRYEAGTMKPTSMRVLYALMVAAKDAEEAGVS